MTDLQSNASELAIDWCRRQGVTADNDTLRLANVTASAANDPHAWFQECVVKMAEGKKCRLSLPNCDSRFFFSGACVARFAVHLESASQHEIGMRCGLELMDGSLLRPIQGSRAERGTRLRWIRLCQQHSFRLRATALLLQEDAPS